MNEMIATRITQDFPYTVDQIDAKAKEFSMSRAELMLYALRFFMGMAPEAWQEIKGYSDAFGTDPATYISNILIVRKAQQEAHRVVWGPSPSLPQWESMADENGVLTGERLYESLKTMFVHEEELKRLDELKAAGAPYDEEETAFMLRFQGKNRRIK